MSVDHRSLAPQPKTLEMEKSMDLTGMIEVRNIVLDLPAASKADLLRNLSGLAAERTGIEASVILEVLINRERLGSTGIGNGVAIPHANVPSLRTPFRLLARLQRPIGFQAIDDLPVDLVFLALSPMQQGSSHLNLLAGIARNARSERWLAAVRQASSPAAVHALFAGTGD